MTIADVLTDEFIARVQDRIMTGFRHPSADLSDQGMRRRIRLAIEEERMPTFRFIVEVKAADRDFALRRLRCAIEPDPAKMMPPDIHIDVAESVKVFRGWPEPDEREAMRGG